MGKVTIKPDWDTIRCYFCGKIYKDQGPCEQCAPEVWEWLGVRKISLEEIKAGDSDSGSC